MRLSDLTADQRLELKQTIVEERNDFNGEGTSCGELADAGELVSDVVLEAWYEDTEFSPDDFSCVVATERGGVLDELKEWAKRELLMARYAKPGAVGRLSLEVELGIDWARKALLDHIEAVRP